MSESFDTENKLVIAEVTDSQGEKNEPSTSGMSGDKPSKRVGRRPGRRSSKMDVRAKLERSRQSARECRARKKLRYQYLEDLVANREKAVFALRDELELYKQWCIQVDQGLLPLALIKLAREADGTREKDPLEGIPEGAEGGEDTLEEDDIADLDDILEKTDQAAEPLLVNSSRMLLKSGEKKHSMTHSPKSTTTCSGKQPVKGNGFRIPKSINKSRASDIIVHSEDTGTGATGFLSDLSSYSTVGFSDVEGNMSGNSQENTSCLSTIIEEEVPEISDRKTNTKLPLLPTFVNEFQDD